MRYDYLNRYWDLYGSQGFKKLVSEGYNFSNAHYDFVPTITGAGHANISTGTGPSINGIVSNEWYERSENKVVYCVEDGAVQTTGSTSNAGKMSPKRLLSSTVGDELRLASNFNSKVFGVALKDRGAILSTGRAANGAYWFDDLSGNFTTSSYYGSDLPSWVQESSNLHACSYWYFVYGHNCYERMAHCRREANQPVVYWIIALFYSG
jgi:predicted AlkP superfamily pyrophosphatase or phosphodiesterase